MALYNCICMIEESISCQLSVFCAMCTHLCMHADGYYWIIIQSWICNNGIMDKAIVKDMADLLSLDELCVAVTPLADSNYS